MQEGDVQIKGYPVRLPLDLMLVFTANPEDYTARGKIITPLKDRIGSEIRTHYPVALDHGMAITEQEAWAKRTAPIEIRVPSYIREAVEQLAFSAREDKRVDKRSGVSQRLPISVLENVISNAERRALSIGDAVAVPRVMDIYAGAALDHRQARTGVRRRAQGRRRHRARADSPGRRQSVHADFRRREYVDDHPVVRTGRLAEAGRDAAVVRT